jgi:hypothetical protein
MADKMYKIQLAIFDCAMVETSTIDTLDCEERFKDSMPRLCQAMLHAHEELMASCEGPVVCSVSLRSSDGAEAGDSIASTTSSSVSEEDSIADSDETASQSSGSDAASEPRFPSQPHGAGACKPCCFFARGICRRGNVCLYCHEHPYVPPRPIRHFTRRGHSLQRSSEQVAQNMFA